MQGMNMKIAWYISQLERNDMWAMRANWGSKSDLHDRLADLLGKHEANGTYFPNGEWWLYKYYNEMRGQRLQTNVSSDMRFDVFATREDGDRGVVKILAGTRTFEDIWDVPDYEIVVEGLGGEGDAGVVGVKSWRFDYEGNQTEIGPPVDLGTEEYEVVNGTIRIFYSVATNETAYAFEIGAVNGTGDGAAAAPDTYEGNAPQGLEKVGMLAGLVAAAAAAAFTM